MLKLSSLLYTHQYHSREGLFSNAMFTDLPLLLLNEVFRSLVATKFGQLFSSWSQVEAELHDGPRPGKLRTQLKSEICSN